MGYWSSPEWHFIRFWCLAWSHEIRTREHTGPSLLSSFLSQNLQAQSCLCLHPPPWKEGLSSSPVLWIQPTLRDPALVTDAFPEHTLEKLCVQIPRSSWHCRNGLRVGTLWLNLSQSSYSFRGMSCPDPWPLISPSFEFPLGLWTFIIFCLIFFLETEG